MVACAKAYVLATSLRTHRHPRVASQVDTDRRGSAAARNQTNTHGVAWLIGHCTLRALQFGSAIVLLVFVRARCTLHAASHRVSQVVVVRIGARPAMHTPAARIPERGVRRPPSSVIVSTEAQSYLGLPSSSTQPAHPPLAHQPNGGLGLYPDLPQGGAAFQGPFLEATRPEATSLSSLPPWHLQPDRLFVARPCAS